MSATVAITCYFYTLFLSFPNESQYSRVTVTATMPFISGSCPYANQANVTRVETAKLLCARILLSRKVDLQHNSIFQHQGPQQHPLLIHLSYLLLSKSTNKTCCILTGYFQRSLLKRQNAMITHMSIRYSKDTERNNRNQDFFFFLLEKRESK